MAQPNFYTLLSLNPGASNQEIEQRIRQRLGEVRRLVNHPERGREAAQALQSLRAARQVLLNPDQKEKYDQSLRVPVILPLPLPLTPNMQKLALLLLGWTIGLIAGWLLGNQSHFEPYQ